MSIEVAAVASGRPESLPSHFARKTAMLNDMRARECRRDKKRVVNHFNRMIGRKGVGATRYLNPFFN